MVDKTNSVLVDSGPLSLSDRADMYARTFPNYPPLHATDRWLLGVWMIGNCYKRKHGFHGEYPPSYLGRILSLFPDVGMRETLHLFAGTVAKEYPEALTYDISPEFEPTWCADVMDIGKYKQQIGQVALVIADPPYTTADAKRYLAPPMNKRLVLREVRKVVRPGGFLVWLDLIIPIYRKQDWQLVGTIALLLGTNRRVRVISIFWRSLG